MSQPHIGDIAEKFVELWTSQAGFTVLTVQRDRRGWDCLCEFSAPRPPRSSDPLGLETVDFCAKVQVKSTRTSKRVVRVKLSNMFRAVDDVLPWFFLILRFDSKAQQPTEVALVHIGPALIESVLKRIYHLPREARRALHKHSFDLKWGSSETVEPPYPASIHKIVYAAVGSDPLSYAQLKRDWYRSAGRTGEDMLATFQIRGATEEELYRRLSRSAIGLDDALTISSLVVTTTRFGITEPSERLSSTEGAVIRIEPTASEMESELIVSRADGSRAVPLKCSVRFSGAVFPQLPEKYWLLRFQTRLLDLVFGETQRHFDARLVLPHDDETITLAELAPSFAFLDFLRHSIGTPLDLRLLRAGTEVALGQLVLPAELPSDLSKLTKAVCSVVELARHVGADFGTAVSLSCVYDCGSLAEFMLAAKAERPLQVLLETRIRGRAIDLSQPTAVISNPIIRIGSVVHGLVVAVSGSIHLVSQAKDESHIRVMGSSLRSIASVQLTPSQAVNYSWEPLFRRAAAELEAEGFANVITAPLGQTEGFSPDVSSGSVGNV